MDEPNIAQFLISDAAVAELLADRIYPELLPQTDGEWNLPAAVFLRLGGDRQKMFCQTDSLVQATYLVTAFSYDYDTAVALIRAIGRKMIDYCGPMGDVEVDSVSLTNDSSLDVAPIPGLFRRSETFTIWYRELRA